MFKIILVTALLGFAASASIDSTAEIRSFSNVPADAEGNFAYSFDTTNGIAVQESGNIAGVTGAAQYISPEGIPVQITYKADENGYQPSGDLLPISPPIPEAIVRALAYIAAHPSQEERGQKLIVKSIPFKG
ncbi:pupal cuticle protein Edg-78E-like [Eupeodes corollae]|uniref:pupal cuticle protein Edg-78E-like n=1 Tax=Eupeodes corollae TaxID=290404 RepID=UPI00249253CE|nr:pupal cuticle protein Edg-78E-like [Eupeodes corollae]